MAALKLSSRIPASSLLETIVSMVVILLVFGIAMTIYVNVTRTSTTLAEISAMSRLEKMAEETKRSKAFFDEQLEEDGVVFEKRVTRYKALQGLWRLELKATDKSNKILSVRNELIQEEADE